MSSTSTLAIIGSGASAIFLLQHIVNNAAELRGKFGSLVIFEKEQTAGTGMPYSPRTTDRFNLSNISSSEIPDLPEALAEWLRRQPPQTLGELGVGSEEISEDGIYSRLAVGRYLQAQYRELCSRLKTAGFALTERVGCKIIDVRPVSSGRGLILVSESGEEYASDLLVVATGHYFTGEDRPMQGYYASPWPIQKLMPDGDCYHNFTIGTLGASLSAFDVVSSLAHRHGEFQQVDGKLNYRPYAGTDGFKIVMHSLQGLLPHIQFEQVNPFREVYRHVSRKQLLSLVNPQGFLRLSDFFAEVCRPVLAEAFTNDGMNDMVERLRDHSFGFGEMAEELTKQHSYDDPFDGMALELSDAEVKVAHKKPVHWKEALDDLLYTLNFHAALLPAEDHLLLEEVILPFALNVVAAMPLKSARAIIALHEAGKLEISAGKVEVVDDDSARDTRVQVESEEGGGSELRYRMFVDCSGQKPLQLEEFPFPALVREKQVTEALAPFADAASALSISEGNRQRVTQEGAVLALKIGGIRVSDNYRVMDASSSAQAPIHDVAFPHMTGLRPYSYGLQACNETAAKVVQSWLDGDQHQCTRMDERPDYTLSPLPGIRLAPNAKQEVQRQ